MEYANSKALQEIIDTYKREDASLRDKLGSAKKDEEFALYQIEMLKKQRGQLGLWKKVTSFFNYKKNINHQESAIELAKTNTSALKSFFSDTKCKLIDNLLTKQITCSPVLESITILEKELSELLQIHRINKDILRKAKKVLDKISDASSEISGAQGMELLDLATDNKAISFMSTMSNSSAQSSLNNAQEAAKELQTAINDNKALLSDLKGISNTELIDFTLDLLDIGFFDIGSIFSLSALSAAESDLDELESQVNNLLPKLAEAVQKSEKSVQSKEKELYDIKYTLAEDLKSLLEVNSVDIEGIDMSGIIHSNRVIFTEAARG